MVLYAVSKSGPRHDGQVADDEEPKGLTPASGDRGKQPDQIPPPFVPPGPVPDQQWREFQEFQRFQEFQKNSPPTRNKPKWLRILLGKWARRLVFLLVLALAAMWAYQHYFGGPDEALPASETGGGETERTVLFETAPDLAVRKVYNDVAHGILPNACTRFETPAVERKFADAFGTADCPSAVRELKAQVVRVDDYERPLFPPKMKLLPGPDGQVVISSCEMDIKGGPRLGRFTVKKIAGSRAEQWTISDFESELCRTPPGGPTG